MQSIVFNKYSKKKCKRQIRNSWIIQTKNDNRLITFNNDIENKSYTITNNARNVIHLRSNE